MRFPLITTKTLTAWLIVLAGGAFITLPVHADLIDPPPPEALPNDEPLEDHTAQDGPLEDHTAQDGTDPIVDPKPIDPNRPPRWEKGKPPVYGSHRRDAFDPLDPDADPFQIPILDLIGITPGDAPDLRDVAGGPVDAFGLLDQLNHYRDPSQQTFVGPTIGTSAVPAPSVLVVIGLGGLALRGRRRR